MRISWQELLATLIGAALGTGARLATDVLLAPSNRDFPLSTLIVNVVGSFALGLLVARVWPTAAPWLRSLLGVGLLGSFTTFSALAVSVATLPAPTAALYLALSLVLGLAAAFVGLRLGSRAPVAIDEATE